MAVQTQVMELSALALQEVQMLSVIADYDIGGLGNAALLFDVNAMYALADELESRGLLMQPFEVGKTYMVMTVTLYWIGRVKAINGPFVHFEEASWVHWTGRLAELCEKMEFTSQRERPPRTEFVDEVIVNMGHIAAAIPEREGKPWNCPTTSIQRD